MKIASQAFLLIFLPIGLVTYWLILRQARHRLIFLFVLSMLFYGLAAGGYLLLLISLSVTTYWVAHKKWFGAGILLNLAALGIFKIGDFNLEHFDWLLDTLNLSVETSLLRLSLPLGISFYVFRHIGYLLDVRSNRYPPSDQLLLFLTYAAYFPAVSAGPLSDYRQIADQLSNIPKTPNTEIIQNGLLHLSTGLAKKILVANTLQHALEAGLYGDSLSKTGLIWAWLSLLVFAFQLYFDFSGYTDMAIGISLLFGVVLPPNFDNPYQATNLTQFWQRWHISLSSWFRLYIYLPISRGLLRRFGAQHKALLETLANLATMILIGAWHGLSWPYLLWGGYHGLLLSLRPLLNWRILSISSPRRLAQALTFLAILVGWAIFLSPDLPFANHLFTNLAGLHGLGAITEILQVYDKFTLATLVIAATCSASGIVEAKNIPVVKRPWYFALWGTIALLCILQLAESVEFIYVLF